jgi:hypothetical protein
MRWCVLAGFVFLAMGAGVRADEGCSQEHLKVVAEKVKAGQAELLGVSVGYGGVDTGVPVATQNLIRGFKDGLAAAADAFMDCERGGATDAKGLESRLADLLGANRADSVRNPAADTAAADRTVDEIYGAELSLAVRREGHDPPLISLKIGFDIPCGVDEMLLIYESSGNGWRRMIRWQSDPYSQISGAFGDFFEYAVFGERRGDDWRVAVAHGKPWCSSSYSGFDLDVLRPATGAIASQQTVFHQEAAYWRDMDSTLHGEPDGFTLRLNVNSLSTDRKVAIYHYRMHQGQVHRYQPVAENARDFLDEWIQTDWNEAADWTARPNLKSLAREHDILVDFIDKFESKTPEFAFGPVQACSGKQKMVQVELGGAPTGWFKYFQIEQGKDSFTLVSGSNAPDPKCTGPDLMSDH